MPTEVLQRLSHTLSLSDEERDGLLALLNQALGDQRTEAAGALARALIAKLERPGTDLSAASTRVASGLEEGMSATEVLFIGEQGRFQMASEELGDFIQFLRDNKVRVEVETEDAFQSGGRSYGYGRLVHPFDADSVKGFFQMWHQAQRSRGAGEVV